MPASIPGSITAERPLELALSPRLRFLLERWRRFRRHRAAMMGLVPLLGLLALSFAAPLITDYDPERQNLARVLRPVSSDYPLGTDHLGRDMLARLLYGGRLSLLIGFLAVGIGLVVGVPVGAISGFQGGLTDLVI